MLDSTQTRYEEKAFWTDLCKNSENWLPTNIRFIFAANYMMGCPTEFLSLERIERKDFLLDRQEYDYFMSSPAMGFSRKLTNETLKQLIWTECGGLIGAVRQYVDMIECKFLQVPDPSESSVLSYYFSYDLTKRMARCFASQHKRITDEKLLHSMRRVFLGKQRIDSFSVMKDPNLIAMAKVGLIVENDGVYDFSSPLAKRYYLPWLFPYRYPSRDMADTLTGHILNSIKHFSSLILKQSTVSASVFPKEHVFQHLMLDSMDCCMPFNLIYTDLPERLAGIDDVDAEPIKDENSFFVSGNLKWGIEIIVNDDQYGEHINRFSPTGKYRLLGANDYVVVDLRPGPVTSVKQHEKRITVFFDESFSKYWCLCGLETEPVQIELAP